MNMKFVWIINKTIIVLLLILFSSCIVEKNNNEEQIINKKINALIIRMDIKDIEMFFNENNIEYDIRENIDKRDYFRIGEYLEINDKILFSIYFTEKNKDLIKVITETYYLVYIIFDENNKLKKIVFDKAYMAL
ncbi:hypothetical protein AGMMS49579_24510 [Spirochaetia bacterium]|nr:hypothetical protein AGMMS49579_24510 [Spirochaetia bacterium]